MADVVDLIEKDHREVERLLAELKNDPVSRPGLIPVLTTLLTAHSRAEESEIYPAIAEAGGSDDVKHSQAEHLEADQILEKLADADPESDEAVQYIDELTEAITHHIEEEESDVLPHLRADFDADRQDELRESFLAVRGERLGDQPEDITRDDLRTQARNVEMDGASNLDKAELKEELSQEAEH